MTMNPLQRHVAGATVSHQSPFSQLDVPVCYDRLPPELRDMWVLPLCYGIGRKHTESFLASHLRLASDALIYQLLSHFDWRSKVAGAYLAAFGNRVAFTQHIGRLLLRSDVCYAGSAYCSALAAFNNAEGIAFIDQYLDYYLQRPDLTYDQHSAMGALAYLDGENLTNTVSRHIGAWRQFVTNNKTLNGEPSFDGFESHMLNLKALTKAHGG